MELQDYPSIREFNRRTRFIQGEYTPEEVIEMIESDPRLDEDKRIEVVEGVLGDVSIKCYDCGQLTKYYACTLYYPPVPKKNESKKIHLCSSCVKKRKTKELKQTVIYYIISCTLIVLLICFFLTKL